MPFPISDLVGTVVIANLTEVALSHISFLYSPALTALPMLL